MEKNEMNIFSACLPCLDMVYMRNLVLDTKSRTSFKHLSTSTLAEKQKQSISSSTVCITRQ